MSPKHLLPNRKLHTKPLLLIILSILISSFCFAQESYFKELYPTQPSQLVFLRFFQTRYVEAGGQDFYVNIKNLSNKKLKISGEVVCTTVCGNDVSAGKFHGEVEPGAELDNMHGSIGNMASQIFDNHCSNPEITHPHSGNPRLTERNRIRYITIKGMTIDFVENKPQATGNRSTNSVETNNDNITEKVPDGLNGSSSSQSSETNHQMGKDGNSQQRQADVNTLIEIEKQETTVANVVGSMLDDLLYMLQRNTMENAIRSNNLTRTKELKNLTKQVSDGHGHLTDCEKCDGEGSKTCTECKGTATIDCIYCGGTGSQGNYQCSHCSGKGKVVCTKCNTTGKLFCFYCEGTGKKFVDE